MFFDHVYITSAGYEILAQATAGSTPGESNQAEIVWANAITSNIPITSMTPSQINALTPSSFPSSSYTSSGNVTSVSYNRRELPVGSGVFHDVATITVMMKNDQYNGSANTLCIFGKLKNDSTNKLIIIAGADDPQQVPSGDPYEAIIDCHIELNMSAVNSVAADSSWYASADAFQSLENRVVTKYKNISGGSYVGEDQDIYGIKTFKTTTKHSGSILPTANSLTVGDSNNKWNSMYATTFNGNATSASKWQNSRTFTIKDYDSTNSGTSESVNGTGDVTLLLPRDIKADSFSGLLNGTATQAWSSYSLNVINDDNFVAGFNTDSNNTNNYRFYPLSTSGSTFDLGETSHRWNILYTNTIVQTVFDCTTAAATAAKTTTITRLDLTIGCRISIRFTKGNSASSPTLNITKATGSTTGAKNINCLRDDLPTNAVVSLVYNGSSWDAEGANSSATRLKNAPSLSFTDATSGTAGSTLTVTAGGKTSSETTITTVRRAYRPYIEPTSSDGSYYIVLGGSVSGGSTISAGFKDLHSDTANSFYYNPSSNRLSVPNVTTTNLNVSSLNILSSINLMFIALYIQNPSSYTLYIRANSLSDVNAYGTYSLVGYDTITGSYSNSYNCPFTRYTYIGSNYNFTFNTGSGYYSNMGDIARFKLLTTITLPANSTHYYPAIILSKV